MRHPQVIDRSFKLHPKWWRWWVLSNKQLINPYEIDWSLNQYQSLQIVSKNGDAGALNRNQSNNNKYNFISKLNCDTLIMSMGKSQSIFRILKGYYTNSINPFGVDGSLNYNQLIRHHSADGSLNNNQS